MSQLCIAPRCVAKISAPMIYCKPHWLSLPIEMRIEIIRHYDLSSPNPWQKSEEYREAINSANVFLAKKTRTNLGILVGACEEKLKELEMEQEKPRRCKQCLAILTDKEKSQGVVCDICRRRPGTN